jgi:hypothetical protein
MEERNPPTQYIETESHLELGFDGRQMWFGAGHAKTDDV